MNLFWLMRCKEKYVGDCPHRKQKETKPMAKPFTADSFSLLGMGEQNVGSHLVTMRMQV